MLSIISIARHLIGLDNTNSIKKPSAISRTRIVKKTLYASLKRVNLTSENTKNLDEYLLDLASKNNIRKISIDFMGVITASERNKGMASIFALGRKAEENKIRVELLNTNNVTGLDLYLGSAEVRGQSIFAIFDVPNHVPRRDF